MNRLSVPNRPKGMDGSRGKSNTEGATPRRGIPVAEPRFQWSINAGRSQAKRASFDFLILGGGFSGATVALQLLPRDPGMGGGTEKEEERSGSSRQ